jgi:hypothetical protein
MAYDAARAVSVLFGGDEYQEMLPVGHTWEWDGARWSDRGDSAPGYRLEPALAYDRAPLVLTTTPVWGDVVGTGGTPADGVLNGIDIAEMVNRFRNVQGAPPRSWCDLFSNNPTQGANLNIDALDISVAVDAFRGGDCAFSGPTAPNPCP